MAISSAYPTTRPTLTLDFAKSKQVDPIVTFTRASTGTFVDHTGIIRTALVNRPRITHDPVTGKCLGLLVEEARTNHITHSEDVSAWLAAVNVTTDTNQTTAPDGASTADRYLETAVTGLHGQETTSFTFVTGTVYTYSVFVKSINGRNFEIGFPVTVFTNRFAKFNLATGAIHSIDAGITATITAHPDGWYRCSATNTCASGADTRMVNFINDEAFARNYAGNTANGVFIWGAQLEAGAFPTSYIPTTGTAATRAADIATITGTNFSRWYRQDEGTMFARAVSITPTTHGLLGVDNGTNSERMRLGHSGTSAASALVVDGSVTQANIATPTTLVPLGVQSASAFAYRLNDFTVGASGVLTASPDVSGTLPTVTQATIGTAQGTTYCNGPIARLTFFPRRLPDSTLQTLTTF